MAKHELDKLILAKGAAMDTSVSVEGGTIKPHNFELLPNAKIIHANGRATDDALSSTYFGSNADIDNMAAGDWLIFRDSSSDVYGLRYDASISKLFTTSISIWNTSDFGRQSESTESSNSTTTLKGKVAQRTIENADLFTDSTTSEYGKYTIKRVIDFGGASITNGVDNNLIKTIATIPANAVVTECFVQVVEAFNSDDEKGVDLAVCSTTPVDVTTVMTATETFITGLELKSSASGALNTVVQAPHSASRTTNIIGAASAGTHLCFIATDGSNAAHEITTGKVAVYFTYIGTADPAWDTTL